MNRTVALLATVALLLVGNVAYYVWKHWGLITIHAEDKTVSEVIALVERKGGVKIRTNMDTGRKISMHVVKAPLPYVIDVLANLTDTRWQVSYYFAGDKSQLGTALADIAGGKRPEGWKSWHLELPGGMFGNDEAAATDPRKDRWEVKSTPEGTLQAYLEQGARNVSARFNAPESWNPAVSSAPKSGSLSSVAARLAKSAGGAYEEVIMLQGRPRDVASNDSAGAPQADGDGGDGRRLFANNGGSRGRGRGDGNAQAGDAQPDPEAENKRRQAMEERMEAELARMSAAEAAKARAEYEEQKKFRESMRNLSDEERRAKLEERMNQPGTQDRMSNGQSKREAMKTPDQRTERYRGYISRKSGAQGGGTK